MNQLTKTVSHNVFINQLPTDCWCSFFFFTYAVMSLVMDSAELNLK